MHPTRRKVLYLGGAAAIAAAAPSLSLAQPYPSRPVRLIVGFPAGGSTDIIARDIGNELEKADVKALISLARERPNSISYASPGVGSINHLSMELMTRLTGTKMMHVPYRGAAPALNDVIGGRVPLTVFNVIQALPHLQSGAVSRWL